MLFNVGMNTPQALTLDLGKNETVTLTPGATHRIMVGSLTHPAGSYTMTISMSRPSAMNPNTLVSVGCSCPSNRFRGTCRHMATMLECVSLQVHGESHTGSPWVTIPDPAAPTDIDSDDDIWAGIA